MKRSTLTKDWVLVSVQSLKAPGQDAIVLGTQTVDIAVITGVTPQNLDWQPATWIGAADTKRVARTMIGPGTSVPLSAGTYQVWARVTGTGWVLAEPAYEMTVI